MPTKEQRLLAQSLEDQAALINRFLDFLTAALAAAPTAHAQQRLQREIDYQLGELKRVHRLRGALRSELATNEGKGHDGS